MSLRAYFFNSSLTHERHRFPELDILRFVAAVMVLLYHFTASGIGNTMHDDRYNLIATTTLFPTITPITMFGFLGVHLFFLISGFIIFVSAQNRKPIDFAINRAIRLYPTYWLSIVFTVLVLLFFLGFDYPLSVTDIALNLTMVQSYLGSGHLDPVYWTLVVELHFYFIIFLLLLTKQMSAWRFWVSTWLLLSIIYFFTEQPFVLAYLFDSQYAGYFIAGMVFSSIYHRGWDVWSTLIIVASFILCLLSLPEQIKLYNFGSTSLSLNSSGAAFVSLLFGSFALFSSKRWTIKGGPLVIKLGLMTYPLYLTHHQFGRYFIDATVDTLDPILSFSLATILSLAFALAFVWLIDDRVNPKLKQIYKQLQFSLKKKGQYS